MPSLDLRGFDTQSDPMSAIEQIVEDCHGKFISPLEAVELINAVVCEWRH